MTCEIDIVVSDTELIVVEVGVQGPVGPPGPPGTPGHSAQTDDTLLAGSAVYVTGTGTWRLADASGLPGARFAGISQAAVVATFAAVVNTVGPIALTTTQWDAVTGQVGGLTPGAQYWLSTTAGQISTASPAAQGEFSVQVGKALNTTTLDITPRYPIKL